MPSLGGIKEMNVPKFKKLQCSILVSVLNDYIISGSYLREPVPNPLALLSLDNRLC